MTDSPPSGLSLKMAMVWAVAAAACFHLAYEIDWMRGLIVGFLFCLIPLARLNTHRKAFYFGLGLGLGRARAPLFF